MMHFCSSIEIKPHGKGSETHIAYLMVRPNNRNIAKPAAAAAIARPPTTTTATNVIREIEVRLPSEVGSNLVIV